MKQRPNILWICTDQHRYDTIGALGNPHIRTPNLDRLCAEGTAFSTTYCQNPICTPSRGSFMTGLYASTIHSNINGNISLHLPDRAKLISRHIADQGYVGGLIGKLHLSSPWDGHEKRVDDGYEEFHHSLSPGQLIDTNNEYTDWLDENGVLDEVLDQTNRNDTLRMGVKYHENIPFKWHQTTWCANTAIDFIRRRTGSPWFLSINTFDPHLPMDAPDDFRKPYETEDLPPPLFTESDLELQQRLSSHLFASTPERPEERHIRDKASYYGMIEIIDRNVGRILDTLEEMGLRKDTVIIFTSDHGESLGDHALRSKGCRFHEGLVRVPLIFSWPGVIQQGVVSDALVELIDIAPTLADIVGDPLEWVQGKSLLPMLVGDAPLDYHREYVRCEYYDVLDLTWGKDEEPAPPSFATMYRDKRYKLNVYHGNEYGELYDLQSDPNEFSNLWEDPANQELKYRLIKASFDASMIITDPGSHRIGRF